MPLRIIFFILFFVPTPSYAYERIISLKPNLTEIIFALGMGDKIVGVTTYCDFPPEVQKIDKVADYLKPDLEKLILKQPDLIVTAQENSSKREIEFLIQKGFKVLTYETNSLEQLSQTILDLGFQLGKTDRAQALIAQMNAQLAVLKQNMKKNSTPRTLLVLGHDPLVVAGSQNLFSQLGEYLGFLNVAGQSSLKYPTYSLEQIFAAQPEMILDFSMGTERDKKGDEEALRWWNKFQAIPAVKNHRVFILDVGKIRASPRLPEELERIAKQIATVQYSGKVF